MTPELAKAIDNAVLESMGLPLDMDKAALLAWAETAAQAVEFKAEFRRLAEAAVDALFGMRNNPATIPTLEAVTALGSQIETARIVYLEVLKPGGPA